MFDLKKYLAKNLLLEDTPTGPTIKTTSLKRYKELKAKNTPVELVTKQDLNEEKSIKDEIKRASKIILTNLISKNPDGWEDEYYQEEFSAVVDSGEFEVIGNNGFLIVVLMLDWSQRKYEEGIYKEVDELLNNYDWDRKFKRYKINEGNKSEGVINEGVNLDDTLDTPQEFIGFIEEQIKAGSTFDKILKVRFPKLDIFLWDAETVILNESPYSYENEEIEEEWDDIKERFGGGSPTKRAIFLDLLDRLDGWKDIENFEEYEGEFEEKHGIDNDTFQDMFEKYQQEIYQNYKKLQ